MLARTALLASIALAVSAGFAFAGDPDDIVLFNNQAGGPNVGLWSLTYTPAAPNTFSPTPYDGGQVTFNSGSLSPNPNRPMVGDVNGDGIDDLVRTGANAVNEMFVSAHSADSGGGVGVLAPGDDSWIGTDITGEHFLLGDVDGDGTMDAINARPSGGNPATQYHATAFHSDSNGIGQSGDRSWMFTTSQPPGNTLFMGDFNGDGYDDIGVRQENGTGVQGFIKVRLSNQNGFRNGNNMGQPAPGYTVAEIVQGRINNQATHVSTLIGDFNGDGIDDVVEVDNRNNNGRWTYVLGLTGATGAASGFEIAAGGTSFGQLFAFPDPTTTIQVPLIGDMNGDGYDDLVEYREYANPNGAPGDMYGEFLVAFTDPGGDLFSTSYSGSMVFELSAAEAGNIPLIGQFTPEPTSLVLLAIGGMALLRRRHG